jgi:glycogen synthase
VNIAFVSYETPFAPCGGIAAVLGRLPARLKEAAHTDTIVVTPFHHRIEKMNSLGRSFEGCVGVDFEGRTITVNIFRHDDKVPYYFLLPEDSRFFAGQRHPYDVGDGELLRDALFFGLAVPQALRVITPGARWTLLLQDWEAATAALAMAGGPDRCRSFVTLHNSYDCPVSNDRLAAVGINPEVCPGDTVLQRALRLTEWPIFSVSEQFAADLSEDVLQTSVMAPHLQITFRSRLVGIENGPFVDLAVDRAPLADADAGRFQTLRDWKQQNRSSFLAALKKLQPSADKPLWGDLHRFAQDDAPWFVMAGRDDARQKGYDVAARAATLFLEQGGDGRFLFFPIPGDEGKPGLGFLERLAEQFPKQVLVFPFLFREGFMSALRGATYGVMPSLYEPFGMANEFYLNGTPGIGRATGGILQQIVPLRAAASFSRAVQTRTARWHSASAQPTGLFFREKDGLPSETDDWSAINSEPYSLDDPSADRVTVRSRRPLFQYMAEELHLALKDAAAIAAQQPDLYYRLITAGVAHIQQNFSWDRAAQEYARHVR